MLKRIFSKPNSSTVQFWKYIFCLPLVAKRGRLIPLSDIEGYFSLFQRYCKAPTKRIKKNPFGIYLLKVCNGNTRSMCEICSKLTIKTPERRFQVFLLLTLNLYHILFWCFHSSLWTRKYRLRKTDVLPELPGNCTYAFDKF